MLVLPLVPLENVAPIAPPWSLTSTLLAFLVIPPALCNRLIPLTSNVLFEGLSIDHRSAVDSIFAIFSVSDQLALSPLRL